MDTVRGVLILFVVIYHLLYDIPLFFPQAASSMWLLGEKCTVLRSVVPGLFILLCGACCHLSRSNLRRALLLGAFALGITMLTLFFLPQCTIRFGILHLLACCILLYCLLEPTMRRIPVGWGIAFCGLLFLFTWGLGYGIIGYSIQLSPALWNRDWLFPLGFPNDRFLSADYFPLMPWGFLFGMGAFCGRYLPRMKQPQANCRSTGMERIGRNTLPIYLLHQPVWLLLLGLLRITH